MIEYRDLDYDKDINEVVTLINKNLDPLYTRDFLLWKHYNNPFGRSISMVATYNLKIVAVVFYMRYNFQNNRGENIRTIRPLDVCTDSEQRGKGLFKILLEKCLEKNIEYELLFSTPNDRSYPEFIKLGWATLVKYKFKIGLVNPFGFNEKIRIENYNLNSSGSLNLNSHIYFTTASTKDFLSWRFSDKEYFKKRVFTDNSVGFLIYRIGKINKLSCLILCDYAGDEDLLPSALQKVCRKEKIYLVYYLNNRLNENIKFLYSHALRPALIIYKETKLAIPQNLLVSLGDIEGRL